MHTQCGGAGKVLHFSTNPVRVSLLVNDGEVSTHLRQGIALSGPGGAVCRGHRMSVSWFSSRFGKARRRIVRQGLPFCEACRRPEGAQMLFGESLPVGPTRSR